MTVPPKSWTAVAPAAPLTLPLLSFPTLPGGTPYRGGEPSAPLAGVFHLVLDEVTLPRDEEALRFDDQGAAVFAKSLGDAFRCATGQRGGPLDAGVEILLLGDEEVVPLLQQSDLRWLA